MTTLSVSLAALCPIRYTCRMRTLNMLLPLVVIFGCAPAGGDMTADTALVAGARDCLELSRVVGRRADGARAIVLETAQGAFRNDLPEACPGLERPPTFTTLVFEPKSGPLCRNDFVRVADADQLNTLGIASGPRCRLGRFTLIPQGAR